MKFVFVFFVSLIYSMAQAAGPQYQGTVEDSRILTNRANTAIYGRPCLDMVVSSAVGYKDVNVVEPELVNILDKDTFILVTFKTKDGKGEAICGKLIDPESNEIYLLLETWSYQ